MGETTTVYDVLKDTIRQLGDIQIPGNLIDQIGIPIARSIHALRVCAEAIERSEREQAEATEEKPEGEECVLTVE